MDSFLLFLLLLLLSLSASYIRSTCAVCWRAWWTASPVLPTEATTPLRRTPPPSPTWETGRKKTTMQYNMLAHFTFVFFYWGNTKTNKATRCVLFISVFDFRHHFKRCLLCPFSWICLIFSALSMRVCLYVCTVLGGRLQAVRRLRHQIPGWPHHSARKSRGNRIKHLEFMSFGERESLCLWVL